MKKKIIKFICNLILVPDWRRKCRKIFLEPKMHFQIKVKPEFTYNDNVIVSIIIPVFNNYNLTYECLKSICYYKPNVPFEIIIADDVSSDKTKKNRK